MKSMIYYSLPDLDFLWSNFFHHRPAQKRNNVSSTGFFQSVLFMAICQILLSHLMADIASWIQILVTLKLIRNGLKSFLKENSYSNEPIFSQKMSCSLYTSMKNESRFFYIYCNYLLGCHNVKYFGLDKLIR